MLTNQEIRRDLKDIRYYYSKQKLFEDASKTIVQNTVLEKVSKYNQAMKDAPARLFSIYISLYVQNNTQTALAYDWGFSIEYIKLLSKQLCEFLQQVLN